MKALDPLLHSQLRLAVVSLLVKHDKLDFRYLKEKTESTSGNLSVQLKKLQEAGYIEVSKAFKNNYPLTTCRISEKGLQAFEAYIKAISEYLDLE
jgi:DNA-binding PadR family transcriptional regulator